MKKSLIAAMAVVALGAGALGTNAVFAAEDGKGPANNLVSAIAERFNLDPVEVQAVFDAEHEEIRAAHEARAEERLQQMVVDGELTQEQADLITTKHEEHRALMEGLKDLTEEERGTAMKTHMEELRAWAEKNTIPVGMLIGRGHHDGRDHGKHEGMKRFHERMDERKAR